MGGYPILRVSADGHDVVVDQPVEVTVGRDPDADLSVSHPLVSRRHLVLRPGTVGWIVEDAGSTNGTFQDGRRISWLRIDGPMRLRLGDPDGGQELRVEPVLGGTRPKPAVPVDPGPDTAEREGPRGRAPPEGAPSPRPGPRPRRRGGAPEAQGGAPDPRPAAPGPEPRQ